MGLATSFMLKVDNYGSEFLVNMWLANVFLII